MAMRTHTDRRHDRRVGSGQVPYPKRRYDVDIRNHFAKQRHLDLFMSIFTSNDRTPMSHRSPLFFRYTYVLDTSFSLPASSTIIFPSRSTQVHIHHTFQTMQFYAVLNRNTYTVQ